MHSDADSRLSSISSESCPNLLQTSATLEAALQEAQRTLERFDTAVSLMNDDMARLQHIFSAREARELLSEISAINKTSASFVPVIIAFILITVLTLFSISLWFNTLVEPLREVMQAMKDFLDRGVMPPKNITSHVTELNQMIEWLMLFCTMTASEQHKNQVIAEQYKTLIKESQRDPLTGVYNRLAFEEIASSKAPLPPMATSLAIPSFPPSAKHCVEIWINRISSTAMAAMSSASLSPASRKNHSQPLHSICWPNSARSPPKQHKYPTTCLKGMDCQQRLD